MKAMILCGGLGTRTKKEYPDTPKALILHKDKPMLERHLKALNRFDVVLNVRADEAKHFYKYKLPLLIEANPIGNAGAIRKFIDELGYRFLVIHNDIYHDIDYVAMTTICQGTVIMAAKDIAKEKEFGIVTKGKNYHVTEFTRRRFINCGAYCMYRKVGSYIKYGKFQDIDKDLIPKLIKANELYYYEHKGKWKDIGA